MYKETFIKIKHVHVSGIFAFALFASLFSVQHSLAATTLDYTPVTDEFSGQTLASPNGVAVIPTGATNAGMTYVMNGNGTIYRYDTRVSGIASDPTFTPFAPSKSFVVSTSNSAFNGQTRQAAPTGAIAVDSNGYIYVAMAYYGAGEGDYYVPVGYCPDPPYYLNLNYWSILVYNPTGGAPLAVIDAGQYGSIDGTNGTVKRFLGLAVKATDANNITLYATNYQGGNYYNASATNNVYRYLTTTGVTGFSAPTSVVTGGIGTAWGIALDSAGSNLYVADTMGNQVKKYVVASLPTATSSAQIGSLYSPTGVATDATGNVFIAFNGLNIVIQATSGLAYSAQSSVARSGLLGLAVGGGTGSNVGKIFSSDVSGVKRLVLHDGTPPTVNSFSVPTTFNATTITGITMSATDDLGVTGYLITESSATPSLGDAGWSGTAPTSYTTSSAGAKTLYAWAKDAAGNISLLVAGQPCTITTTLSYTVTTSAGANGTISPSQVGIAPGTDSVFMIIAPATGYYLASVLVDGVSVGTGLIANPATFSYKFFNVQANHTLSATFALPSAILSKSTYTSNPIALDASLGLGTLNWAPVLPGGASNILEMRVRSCDDNQCNSFSGIDESVQKPWTTCGIITGSPANLAVAPTPTNGLSCVTPGDQFVQYQVTMATTDAAGKTVPTFGPVAFTNTSNYGTNWQNLVSSPLDSGDNFTAVSSLAWTTTGGSNTNIKFQLRTAPDSLTTPGTPDWANGSGWCGPGDGTNCSQTMGDGTTGTYYTASGSTPNSTQSDRVGNRWVQYATFLQSTDGISTPTKISSVTTSFTFNSPPVLSGATVAQLVSGAKASQLQFGYSISDVDVGSSDLPNSQAYQLLTYQPKEMTLSAGIDGVATTIVLKNPNILPIPTQGYVLIDNELIKYSSEVRSGSGFNTIDTLTVSSRHAAFDDGSGSAYPTLTAAHTATTPIFFKATNVTFDAGVSNPLVAITTTAAAHVIIWDAKNEPNMTTSLNNAQWWGWQFKVAANDGGYGNNFGSILAYSWSELAISGLGDNSIGSPTGITFDAAGNLYVADPLHSRILKRSALNVWTALTPAGLTDNTFTPYEMATDGAGNLYVADLLHGRILQRSALNVWTALAPAGLTDNTLLNVYGVAADAAGDVYVADSGSTAHNRILQRSALGVWTVLTPSGLSNNSLAYPQSVAVDSAGNLYVADTNGNRILQRSAGGVWSVLTPYGLSNNNLNYPGGVAVDSAGNMYVVDSNAGRILKQSVGTGSWTNLVVGGLSNNSLANPKCAAVDSVGNVYVADYVNNRVLVDYNYLLDLKSPNISAATPAAGSFIKSVTASSKLAFTTDEALSSGKFVFAQASGTVDSNTHACTLKPAGLLTVGAHSAITMDTTNCTETTHLSDFVDGAKYDMTFVATDMYGNSTTIANTGANGITYDTTLPTISSLGAVNPSSAYSLGDQVPLKLNMSEPVSVSAGSFTLTLNNGKTCTSNVVAVGSETQTPTCSYTVAAGDDTQQLYVTAVSAITANSILDRAGNALTAAAPTLNDTNNAKPDSIIIDTISKERLRGNVKLRGNIIANDYWLAPGATGCIVGAGDQCRASVCANDAGTNKCMAPCNATSTSGSTCGFDGFSYGIITGADGKLWMDRNLGASQVATLLNDYLSYGGLYQWGRKSDGHQKVVWTNGSGGFSSKSSATPVENANPFIVNYSPGPPYSNYFLTSTPPTGYNNYDWLSDAQRNDTLWAGASGGINNPCPPGFRVPTGGYYSGGALGEWEHVLSLTQDPNRSAGNHLDTCTSNCLDSFARSSLKLPAAGWRNNADAIGEQAVTGTYLASNTTSIFAYNMKFTAGSVLYYNMTYRVYGFSVRCVKN